MRLVAIVKRRQLSTAELQARRAALDAIVAARPLTAEERAERDSLDVRLYHRVWRAQQREAEQSLVLAQAQRRHAA